MSEPERWDEDLPTSGNHIALCSGGLESTVAAHIAVRWGPCDMIALLDTGTMAEPNRRFVERVADTFGATLLTVRTPEGYGERVRRNGFPGPSQHQKMYTFLKERQLGRLATLAEGRGNSSRLHFWTGVRRRESRNRMASVSRVQEADRWTWIAPIHDWTRADVVRYHRRMRLPTSYSEVEVVEEDREFAKLQQGMNEPRQVRKATVDETVQDWLALLRSDGDWSLDDVAARPYQEINDDEMRERVRQLRDTEDKHE